MREYHVAKNGCDYADGTSEHPFLTISKAAEVALAGDRVVVHEGVYREWVKPAHGGHSNVARIVYEAAEGEKVVIKGSEQITNWELVEGNVWKVELPNSYFGSYNPYKEVLIGDWFIYPPDNFLHTGDVYMNGKSFYEAKTLDEVKIRWCVRRVTIRRGQSTQNRCRIRKIPFTSGTQRVTTRRP